METPDNVSESMSSSESYYPQPDPVSGLRPPAPVSDWRPPATVSGWIPSDPVSVWRPPPPLGPPPGGPGILAKGNQRPSKERSIEFTKTKISEVLTQMEIIFNVLYKIEIEKKPPRSQNNLYKKFAKRIEEIKKKIKTFTRATLTAAFAVDKKKLWKDITCKARDTYGMVICNIQHCLDRNDFSSLIGVSNTIDIDTFSRNYLHVGFGGTRTHERMVKAIKDYMDRDEIIQQITLGESAYSQDPSSYDRFRFLVEDPHDKFTQMVAFALYTYYLINGRGSAHNYEDFLNSSHKLSYYLFLIFMHSEDEVFESMDYSEATFALQAFDSKFPEYDENQVLINIVEYEHETRSIIRKKADINDFIKYTCDNKYNFIEKNKKRYPDLTRKILKACRYHATHEQWEEFREEMLQIKDHDTSGKPNTSLFSKRSDALPIKSSTTGFITHSPKVSSYHKKLQDNRGISEDRGRSISVDRGRSRSADRSKSRSRNRGGKRKTKKNKNKNHSTKKRRTNK